MPRFVDPRGSGLAPQSEQLDRWVPSIPRQARVRIRYPTSPRPRQPRCLAATLGVATGRSNSGFASAAWAATDPSAGAAASALGRLPPSYATPSMSAYSALRAPFAMRWPSTSPRTLWPSRDPLTDTAGVVVAAFTDTLTDAIAERDRRDAALGVAPGWTQNREPCCLQGFCKVPPRGFEECPP